jgi:hypothetical protein
MLSAKIAQAMQAAAAIAYNPTDDAVGKFEYPDSIFMCMCDV